MTAKKRKVKPTENILTKFLGGHFEPTYSKKLNWALDQAIIRQRKIDVAVKLCDDLNPDHLDMGLRLVREILTGVVDSPA